MIGAGRLRERIVIKRPVLVPNGSGGYTQGTPLTVLTTYADVNQKQASTDVIASQANIIQPFSFRIRYRTDVVIQIGDRIEWRKRSFEILGFDWDIMRTYIMISAKTENESTSNGAV